MMTTTPQWQQDFERWIEDGTSASTRRAYQRDVHYYWHWVKTHFDIVEHYPTSIEHVLQFCLYHIDSHSPCPLKLSTLRRYLASLSIKHKEHGVMSPTAHGKVRLLLRRAKAAKQEHTDKKAAITLDILNALIATCDSSVTGIRDKAILLVGFSAGGRRRAEIVNIRVEDLNKTKDGYLLTIQKSKTDQTGKGFIVPVFGQAAFALKAWLIKSGLRSGPLFRGIKPNDDFYEAISPRTINLIVKRRIKMIGLNPESFGAHSLRAGFITESSNQGINLTEAMMLSGHKSIKVAQGYCREINLQTNKASHLL